MARMPTLDGRAEDRVEEGAGAPPAWRGPRVEVEGASEARRSTRAIVWGASVRAWASKRDASRPPMRV